MRKTNFREQFTNVADACALAQSIVDTVREPVIVLDKGLRVIAASRSFYSAFRVSPEETQGRLLYTLEPIPVMWKRILRVGNNWRILVR
jgi:PAS domain-containing protein